MNGLVRAFKWLGYSLLFAVAGVLLLAAVATVIVRGVLASADSYRSEIESLVVQFIGQPVHIGALSASWNGLDPELVLEDVGFYTADHSRFFAQFKRAHIGLNLLQTLRTREAVAGAIVVEGAKFEISRRSDGVFELDGLDSAGAQKAPGESSFSDWLMAERFLRLTKSEITYTVANAPPRVYRDVNINLRSRDEHHYVEGTLALPMDLGQNFNISADIVGNPFAGVDWSASFYANGAGLNLSQFAVGRSLAGAVIAQGIASFRVWGDWREGRLAEVKGEVIGSGVRVVAPETGRVAVLDEINATFSAAKAQNAWGVLVSFDKLKGEDAEWPPSRLEARFVPAPLSVEAKLTQLNVEDLGRWLSVTNVLSSSAAETLYNVRPRGQLNNIKVIYKKPPDEAATFSVSSDFERLATDSWEKIPGLEGLQGSAKATESGGRVAFSSGEFPLKFPWLFRAPINVTQMMSAVDWQRVGNGWEMRTDGLHVATADVALGGRVRIRVPSGDESTFVDLAMRTGSGSLEVGKLMSYLPTGQFSKDLTQWLESSIMGGQLTSVAALMYGPVRDWPFKASEGKFDLALGVSGVVLNHTKGWPTINGIEGEFRYHGSDLTFDGRNARIFGNTITEAHVAIADLKAPSLTLTVKGRVVGDSAGKLRYLHESPLEVVFAKSLRVFDLAGNSKLDFSLVIPFAENEKVRANGVLSFEKNRFSSKEYKLDIHDLNGDLKFDEKSVASPKLRGLLGDIAVESTLRTQLDSLPHQLIISNRAALAASDVGIMLGSYLEKSHWAEYLQGRTDTSLELRLPLGSDSSRAPMSLHIRSDLKGMAVSLPKPIQKPADNARPFSLDFELVGDPRILRVNYGYVGSLFEIVRTATGPTVRRGGVSFGGEAALPSEHGFRYSGGIDEFSWGAWSDVLTPSDGRQPLFKSDGASSTQFFDIRFSKLEVFGAHFKEVAMQASNSAQGWSVHTSGPELEGSVYFPTVAKSAPLLIDMDRLHITTEASRSASAPIDPRTLPEAKVVSRAFRYNGLDLGQLQLEASRVEGGLHLDGLKLSSSNTQIEAKGDWVVEQERQRSAFDIDMKSGDMGTTLTDLGYAGTMAGGRTAMKIVANWSGSPADFAFERLSGKTTLRIEKGRLLDVDLGAAKIFGLVSIAALPRRLLGDFGDVSRKGMTFDAIVGEYELKNGNAFTSGVIVDGPTVRLALAGRIGLAKRDFDQVITAIPPALDSLPLLGVAVTAAPPLGATLFVVQKLFQKYFDDLTAVQYTVVGRWENPVITKVDKPSAEPERHILDE